MISPESIKRWVNLLIFGIVGLIVFAVFLTFSLERHYSNFKPISAEDYLNGQVKSIRTYQDTTYMVVNNANYRLDEARNQGYEPMELTLFLKKGDSVTKQIGSDSLFIKRNNASYLFVLNTRINYDKTITEVNTSIELIIKQLDLQPHPEGGYYRETYRSSGEIGTEHLSGNYSGNRNYSTSIYYLLVSDKFSAFHKIHQDEIWHFYEGSPIELHSISESGEYKKHLIGKDFEAGQTPQLVVPGNHWFASKVIHQNSYSLVGCTVAPGFDFDDFTLAKRENLIRDFPQHEQLITEFTYVDQQ